MSDDFRPVGNFIPMDEYLRRKPPSAVMAEQERNRTRGKRSGGSDRADRRIGSGGPAPDQPEDFKIPSGNIRYGSTIAALNDNRVREKALRLFGNVSWRYRAGKVMWMGTVRQIAQHMKMAIRTYYDAIEQLERYGHFELSEDRQWLILPVVEHTLPYGRRARFPTSPHQYDLPFMDAILPETGQYLSETRELLVKQS